MPYEDDYKMWLEKMLIESNPDWVCDGMYDMDFTHEWCGKHCGEDSDYVTPKCLHLYYHYIAEADRKTENSSEIPNNCEPQYKQCFNCKYEESDERCGPCSEGYRWYWEPKAEPTISKMEQVDEPQIETKTETKNSNLTFEKRTMRDCYNCKRYETEGECIECHYEPKDEPQTESYYKKEDVVRVVENVKRGYGLTKSAEDIVAEMQTGRYMTVEQAEDYRKMLDKAEHKVYGNIADIPQMEEEFEEPNFYDPGLWE